ncbi:MAG: polysaccharide deacetylase family protein [Muribaculaceae bacterium]|nr:polysaccharide deacetylase family protein [Muribaculaceae bacterium]
MRHIITVLAGTMLTLGLAGSSCGTKNDSAPAEESVWEYDEFGAGIFCREPGRKTVHLIFTADSAFEAGEYALDAMAARGAKASFFFTGNFLRDSLRNGAVVRHAIRDGHYVGPHGDRHILLADWDAARTTLASRDSAVADMEAAYRELAHYGIHRDDATILIPSFEWYNTEHVQAFRDAGLFTINLSPGIETYRDYTTPDMSYYHSSEFMWEQLLSRESGDGLDGAIILIHLGTHPDRTDKFYRYLPAILDTLTTRGYHFTALK